jgi:hypothetical protein
MSDLEKQLEEAQQQAKKWEGLYAESTIKRALLDAAEQGGAYNPAQVLPYLKPNAKLVEADGQHAVRVVTTSETGQDILHTPAEAVANLKRRSEHANLFKPAPAAPPAPATGGKIDVRKLTHAQFLEIRAKNPEKLGLAPKPR